MEMHNRHAVIGDPNLKPIEMLIMAIGPGKNKFCSPIGFIMTVTWSISLSVHFAADIYEGIRLYDDVTFLVAQTVMLLVFIVATYSTAMKCMVWLRKGMQELTESGEEDYYVTLNRVYRFSRLLLYIIPSFALVISTLEILSYYHGVNDANSLRNETLMTYKLPVSLRIDESLEHLVYVLPVIRFLTSFHVYVGYAVFWAVPTCSMIMTGCSMQQYSERTNLELTNPSIDYTFMKAIKSYSQRINFVKSTSSSCFLLLFVLISASLFGYGINLYMFFFKRRSLLNVFHALLPIILLTYPFTRMAWVTKEYQSFIIVVVQAWIERKDGESDDEDDEDVPKVPNSTGSILSIGKRQKVHPIKTNDDRKKENKIDGKTDELDINNKSPRSKNNVTASWRRFSNCSDTIDLETSLTATVIDRSPSTITYSSTSTMSTSASAPSSAALPLARTALPLNLASTARAVLMENRQRKFSFDKLIIYLESMRTVVGFHVGFLITWDLVSTILFFIFSVLALFLQEAVFGSMKSTI